MAPVNPSRLLAHSQQLDSPLSSRIVLVAIGKEEILFNIHKDKLHQTAFFALHGPLPTITAKLQQRNARTSTRVSSDDNNLTIKMKVDGEDAIEINGEIPDSQSTLGEGNRATNSETNSTDAPALPDYYIEDRLHAPAAFKIFAQWLYNEPPAPMMFRNHCRVLLQTYVLARLYKAYALQNLILQRFREFHAKMNVNFDDLIWMANRVGEDIRDCAMTAYLLEQVAYEITDRGFEEFAANNGYLFRFLAEGELSVIRVELFRMIAKHAHAKHAHASGGRLGDPAEGENLWLVFESGEQAGSRVVHVLGAHKVRDSRVGIEKTSVDLARR